MGNINFNLTRSLKENLKFLKELFKNDNAIKFREFENKYNSNLKYCIIYADGMVNKQLVNEHIIERLMNINISSLNVGGVVSPDNILEIIIKKIIISAEVTRKKDINELTGDMLYGDTLLLIDGFDEGLIIDTKGWPVRALTESSTEKVIKGSREAFTESIMTNTTLIRRRVKNPSLKFIFSEVGTETKTKICVTYIEGIANEEILKELNKRLQNINIDGILESQYIQEFIQDSPLSFFDTIGSTESPDIVAAKLLEGRIGVICDGTPFVLLLPFIFIEYFDIYEDYYLNYIFGTYNRLIRMLAFFMTISVPALYISVVCFHQELIPTSLLISIYTARLGIPFPTVLETLIMLAGFSVLREAGVRLPRPIGQAVSIVGALILGDAAVNARIVSAPIVIVVATTGISSFIVPKMIGACIMVRYIFIVLASFLGLYGYMFGVMGLFLYLMSMRSFGVPYMLNTASIKSEDLKDTAIRAPWVYLNFRNKLITRNRKRQKQINSEKRG